MTTTKTLYHGAMLISSELRKAGVKVALPQPEQYHPEIIVERDGRKFKVCAPVKVIGCGRTRFYRIWEVQ